MLVHVWVVHTEEPALTWLNPVVRASNHLAVNGGGGDDHFIDLATHQIVDGAVAWCGITGGSVSICADGPGGVVIWAGGLSPVHFHHVGVTVQLSHNIVWQAWSYAGQFNTICTYKTSENRWPLICSKLFWLIGLFAISECYMWKVESIWLLFYQVK